MKLSEYVIRTYVSTFVRTHICTCVCIETMYVCIETMYVCIETMYVCTYVRMNVYMYVFISLVD